MIFVFFISFFMSSFSLAKDRCEDPFRWEDKKIEKGFVLSNELELRGFNKIYKKQIPLFKTKNPKVKNVNRFFPNQIVSIQSCEIVEKSNEVLFLPSTVNKTNIVDLEVKEFDSDGVQVLMVDVSVLKDEILKINESVPSFLEKVYGFKSLEELNQLGLISQYNEQKASLEFYLPPDPNRVEKVSLKSNPQIEGELISKSKLSGFLNISTSINYRQSPNLTIKEPTVNRFDSAINFDDFILESHGYQQSDKDFIREDVRISKDIDSTRFVVGDLFYPVKGFQSFRKIGGIGAYSINADQNANSTTASKASDRLLEVKQPSTLTFFVNNQIVATKKVVPGIYDVSEIPLVSGVNQIRVQVEADQSGEKSFFVFEDFLSDFSIKKGRKEFGIAIGSRFADNSGKRIYDNSDQTILGNFRYDFGNKYSTTSYIEANPNVQLLGLIQAFHIKGGHVETDLALSRSNQNFYAWRLNYVKNSSKDFCLIDGDRYNLGYEHRQIGFSNIETTNGYETSTYNLAYSFPKIKNYSVSIGSNFIDNETSNELSKIYSISISKSFTNSFMSLSLTNSEIPKTSTELSAQLAININWDKSVINLSQSRQNNTDTTTISYNPNKDPGIRGQFSQSKDLGSITKSAQTTISTNRNEMTISGVRYDLNHSNDYQSRFGFNHRIGIAFADSKIAIGRPLTDSFWISDSSNQTVELESGSKVSKKDIFGEALLGFKNYSFATLKATTGSEDSASTTTYKALNNYYNGYVVHLKDLISPTVLRFKTNQDIAGSIIRLKNLKSGKVYDFWIDSNLEIYLEQIDKGEYSFIINEKEYRLILDENQMKEVVID